MKITPDEVARRNRVLFDGGLCCAESVLQAVAESRGVKSASIPKIAAGLCAGISRTGGICGAVSGGVLAISLCFGRSHPDESPGENVRRVRGFLTACETKVGATNCEKLVGCRLDTPEGQRFFKEQNLREKCAGFTQEAAQLAVQMIEQSASARSRQSD